MTHPQTVRFRWSGMSRAQLRRALILCLATVCGGTVAARPVSAQATLTVGADINLSKLPGNQAETAVAVNPANPLQWFVTSNTDAVAGLFAAYSTDGGATWTHTDTHDGYIADGDDNLPIACCDSSVSWDTFGNLFLCYLNGNNLDVEIALSTDGGKTFTHIYEGAAGDQPTITTGAGSVWVTYTDFSTNAVEAVGAPVTGSGMVGAFIAPEAVPGSSGDFGDIAIGPNGEVMVTYQNNNSGAGPDTIYVAVDPDGLGAHGFNAQIAATATNVGGFDPIPAQNSRTIDAEAGLAWDRTTGTHGGRVYLVYTDAPAVGSADTDIFVRYSDDTGATWSPRVRVNDDTTAYSQFLPRIFLDQTTGYIAVSWHDCRNDNGMHGPGDTDGIPDDDAEFYASASVDGGATFLPNVMVSAGPSNAADSGNGVEFGDYTGMAFYGGNFYPAWADNSNATADNPNGRLKGLNVYTAKVTLTVAAAPVISSLSPASIAACGPAFTLTVNGSGFVSGAAVRWNGGALTTMFVSSGQLTASVPAAEIAAPGSASVTVVNPNGATSNAVTFAVVNPVPVLKSISPTSKDAGGPAFTLIVKGSCYLNGSTVKWNGSALATTFVSAGELKASVSASLLATPGTALVTVTTPGPGGGTSVIKTFRILVTTVHLTAATLTRNADGSYTGMVTLKNAGYLPANNAEITTSSLGGAATTTSLPDALGSIASGGSKQATLHYPASAGAPGATVKLVVSGKFTGGTFSGVLKLTLP